MLARIFAIAVLLGPLVALSQPPEPPEVADATEGPVTADTGTSDDTAGDQQPTQPSITVVVPEKSPEELDAEREQREREIAIQESISTFTGLIVIVGFLQVAVLVGGLIWTKRAADAAKKSADAARDSILMANRPRLVVRPISVDGIDQQDGRIATKLTNGKARVTNVGVLPTRSLSE